VDTLAETGAGVVDSLCYSLHDVAPVSVACASAIDH
jgi:hypothetical protein